MVHTTKKLAVGSGSDDKNAISGGKQEVCNDHHTYTHMHDTYATEWLTSHSVGGIHLHAVHACGHFLNFQEMMLAMHS